MVTPLEKSLNMLKGVQIRLTNALSIKKSTQRSQEVVVQIKDVRLKQKQQYATFRQSGREELSSGKSNYRAPKRTKDQSISTVQHLRSENKQLRKYIQLLEKINETLKAQVISLNKIHKSDQSFSPYKDLSVYYESDHLGYMKSQLEYLRRINQMQNSELRRVKDFKVEDPKDFYQYITPQRIRHQRSKLLSWAETTIPEYSSHCSCQNKHQQIRNFKLGNSDKVRSKTQYTDKKSTKVGTISHKNSRKKT